MFYDLRNHQRVYNLPTGIFGQISFERLANLLRDTRELRNNEYITHFSVDNSGFIKYRIEQT